MRGHKSGHNSSVDDTLALLAPTIPSPTPSGGGTQYAFVLSAAGPAGANVYTTWAALYAAMSLIAGPKLVEVVGTEHMTAGGPYDLNEVEFVASDPDMAGGGSALVIDNGATIAPGTLHFNDGLLVSYVGTGPCMTTSPAVLTLIDVGRGAQLEASAAGPFLQAVGGTFGFVLLSNGATLGDNTNIVVEGMAGSNVLVQASGRCIVTDNSIDGAGSGLRYDDTTQNNPLSLPGVPTGHLQMMSNADFVAYPGGAAWGATPPTETQDALDRLSAILANHMIAESSGAGPLPDAGVYTTLAMISGFVPTPEGTGKVHVEASAALFDTAGALDAAIGIAVVAHGAAAPTAPDYPPAGLGGNSISLSAGGSACTSILCDYGGGGSFPAALALPGPAGGYDIYLLGTASAAVGVDVNDHGCQLSAQEQL